MKFFQHGSSSSSFKAITATIVLVCCLVVSNGQTTSPSMSSNNTASPTAMVSSPISSSLAPTTSNVGAMTLAPTVMEKISSAPTNTPSLLTSNSPTIASSMSPTNVPSIGNSEIPSKTTSDPPTIIVSSSIPSLVPTRAISTVPTLATTSNPTTMNSESPTMALSMEPTKAATTNPTVTPTAGPTMAQTPEPTLNPTTEPTTESTMEPTMVPTKSPTEGPTMALVNNENELPTTGELSNTDEDEETTEPNGPPPRYHECPASINPINPIILKGKRFFDSVTGEYFPIKGIAYYPRPNEGPLSITNSVDFFTDEFRSLWEPDIANFQKLGINTLRIYGIDPSRNHDAFMCALQHAGIHVMFGLLADCENCGIGAVPAPECYPASLKTRGQFVINTFSRYKNTLAFSAGNEVAWYARDQGGETAWNAPCQKKFLRDMRSYVQRCQGVPNSILPRKVPIGVVTADFDRTLKANYFACRTDPNDELENAEWYGLNSYRHCDPNAVSIDELAGYLLLKDNFASYNLPMPVMIAEFGCRERFAPIGDFEAQRTWLQIDALFNPDYQEVFAGGIVFEYSAEKIIVDTAVQNKPWPYYEFMKIQYGVGYYSPVDCTHLDIPCTYNEYPEFDLLGEKYSNIDVSFIPSMMDYGVDADATFPECPAEISPISDFDWASDSLWDLDCYIVVTDTPSVTPSDSPTSFPTTSIPPTMNPTALPTESPTGVPTQIPTSEPTQVPTESPTENPTKGPTRPPNDSPTDEPTVFPTEKVTSEPSQTTTSSTSDKPGSNVRGEANAGSAATNHATAIGFIVSIGTILSLGLVNFA